MLLLDHSKGQCFTQVWPHKLLQLYLNCSFRVSFHGLYLHKELPKLDPQSSIVLCPNHSSWWDGFFAYYLNHYLYQRDFKIVMLESELAPRPFFRRVGALGLQPRNPAAIAHLFSHINQLLAEHNPVFLTYFPQGRLLPLHTPLKLRHGLKLLKTQAKLAIIPAYFHIEAGRHCRPIIFFVLDPQPLSLVEYKADLSLLAQRMDHLKSKLHASIHTPSEWSPIQGQQYDGY
jgi:1-acyl-sn-glycerol-3-phosphate acyltransferase